MGLFPSSILSEGWFGVKMQFVVMQLFHAQIDQYMKKIYKALRILKHIGFGNVLKVNFGSKIGILKRIVEKNANIFLTESSLAHHHKARLFNKYIISHFNITCPILHNCLIQINKLKYFLPLEWCPYK